MGETTIEQAVATFPTVDESTIETIYNSAESPTLGFIASVLESAAEQGKVPDQPYMEQAAEVVVDKIDDAAFDGVTKEDVLRGMERRRQAAQDGHVDEAVETAKNADLMELVEAFNEKSTLATESLHDPEGESIPKPANDSAVVLANAITERIDLLADRGDKEALKEAQTAIGEVASEDARKGFFEKLNKVHGFVNSDGSEYELAKEELLDERNTPQDVQETMDAIHAGEYDVTWEQMKELTEEATEWLEMYHQFQQEAEAADADPT